MRRRSESVSESDFPFAGAFAIKRPLESKDRLLGSPLSGYKRDKHSF